MTVEFDPLGHSVPEEDFLALDALAKIVRDRVNAQRAWIGGPPDMIAVEVGSWAGYTALVLEQRAEYVFCVDHWEGTPGERLHRAYSPIHAFSTFCSNMGDRLHTSVFPCVGRSLTWASVWVRPADLIYVDADHSYEAVKADLAAWYPHVRPGGTFCGHDYHFSGVKRAVDEAFGDRVKRTGSCIWYVEKGAK